MKVVVSGLVVAVLAACGGSKVCPNDLPSSCPSPAPSYSSAISSLISAYCLSCHSPGGQEAVIPFTSYQSVYIERSPILDQVYACNMPPTANLQLTAQERSQLLGWLVCGAPNN